MGRLLTAVIMIGAGGALLGGLLGAVLLATGAPLGEQGRWFVGLCAVLTGSVAAMATMISARLFGRGKYLRTGLASVLVGGFVGAVVAQQLFATSPRGKQLLLFAVGSLVGGGAFALVRRLRAPATPAISEPRGRWFQFTLGSLLACTVIASMGMAVWVRGPMKRRQTLAIIERSGGGRVTYGSRASEWVCALLGDGVRGFFDEVESIDLNNAADADVARIAVFEHLKSVSLSGNFTDKAMKTVARCRSLERVSLHSPRLTGKGLAELANLPRLRSLWLPVPADDAALQAIGALSPLEQLDIMGANAGPVTRGQTTAEGWSKLGDLKLLRGLTLHRVTVDDRDLAFLEHLPRLRRLWLTDTLFSDAGVTYLRRLKELEWLQIHELTPGRFRGASLGELASLSQLRNLDVACTAVNDQGLAAIGSLRNLESLNLGGAGRITDSGLKHLAALTKVRWLTLSWNSLSDAGLRHLESLTKLESLNYDRTAITAAGIARLEKAWQERRLRAIHALEDEE